MHCRFPMLLVGLFFAFVADSALANDDGFVVWDQNIASAVSARLHEQERCGASPYALYQPRCHRQLNLSFDRPILYFTFLDRAALFLYKYHKVNYNRKLWDNTKLKFELDLKNVYEQEAQARIELRYRFSSALPRVGLPAGPAGSNLPRPSIYQN